nr:enoyl-CoA hydratase-related protein [Sphingobium sp. EM0848]
MEAAEPGLINYVCAKEDIVTEVRKIAVEIAANPGWAVRWSKATVNKQFKTQPDQILLLSITYEAATMMTHDYKEAATAFSERHEPEFKVL